MLKFNCSAGFSVVKHHRKYVDPAADNVFFKQATVGTFLLYIQIEYWNIFENTQMNEITKQL